MSEYLGQIADMVVRHNSREIDLLISQGRRCTFLPGENLITEGEATENVYDLLDGTVALARNGSNGQRQILSFLRARQCLGVASTRNYPNLATALNEVTAIRYPRAALDCALVSTPGFASEFCRVLTRTLEASHDHIYTVGQQSALEQVANFILCERSNQARSALDGRCSRSLSIELPMKRSDIADFLGLKNETVSRSFSALKRAGIISFLNSHRCSIEDLEQLHLLGRDEDFTKNHGA